MMYTQDHRYSKSDSAYFKLAVRKQSFFSNYQRKKKLLIELQNLSTPFPMHMAW